MGGCGGSAKSSGKSNSYTPKKMMGSKGMKTPSSPKGYRSGNAGNFGQPKVRMSFSGRGR
jgi:hypothetical protein